MLSATDQLSPTIAVGGATGEVGGRVARLLAERGVAQRLIVRDASRAPSLPRAEVAVVGGYEDAAGMRAALQGVDAFLLVPGHETADRVTAHRAAVQAAAEGGAGRIVQLSFAGAAPDATFTYARDHWATEQDVRASGLPWTIARMNFYLDVLPHFVLPSGDLAGPAGDGRVAAIARDDVAAALAELLVGGGHAGKAYELTGAEALTFSEIAVTMARQSGRTVTYLRETVDEAYASRAHYEATDVEREGWVTTYTAVAAGELAHVSSDVLQLTGREPQTLTQWLAAHPLALAHVDTLG
ncbi:MAG: NAD(P)H-binding protein [Solirubrobacteraceae bacterium]|nr:NAD(P)H-binding protein [Solirubrobacteraceae bacterium]